MSAAAHALQQLGPAQHAARAVIAHHSKSFALASRLLPAGVRDDAVVLYAYCRRADDAVDEAPPLQAATALRALRRELDTLYRGEAQREPLLAALQQVITARGIPRKYLDDLLDGMAMDVDGVRYERQEQLLLYCYRVAGTVGLMMCHVMGVRDEAALCHAKDLGIAMQLTNIARDVREDWGRGRLYLPDALLAPHGAARLREALGSPLPDTAAAPLSATTRELLDLAEDYYASGDAGLRYLPFRCALAVYTARLVYSAIGTVLRRRGCDPREPRAVVPRARKLLLALRALVVTASAALLVSCAPAASTAPALSSTTAAQTSTPAAAASAQPAFATPAPELVAAEPIAPAASPAESTPSQAAPAVGQVVVDVIGIEKAEGQLVVSLFRDGRGFPDKGRAAHGKKVAKARDGHARLVFEDVPSGAFAVVVLHDQNGDFAMETGLFGMPEEGYGFSRDAHAPFGPPDFADAKLTLAPNERKRVPIHLRY
jgi:phytoene synthase